LQDVSLDRRAKIADKLDDQPDCKEETRREYHRQYSDQREEPMSEADYYFTAAIASKMSQAKNPMNEPVSTSSL
jgi:hypothetical protein